MNQVMQGMIFHVGAFQTKIFATRKSAYSQWRMEGNNVES